MVLSGSSHVAVTAHNRLVFSWAAVQDIIGNQSTIHWTMELAADGQGGLSCTQNASWVVTVDSQTLGGFNNVSVLPGETKALATGTITLDHNEQGERSFVYRFSQDFPLVFGGKPLGTVAGSGTAVLKTILRPSQPTASLDVATMGQPVTIFTNPMAGLTHALEFCFGTASGVIAQGVGESAEWIPPVSLAAQIPTAETGVAKILCRTYFGTVLLGTRELALSLAVPQDLAPKIFLTVMDLSPGTRNFGDPVQNVSKLEVACQGFPVYDSPIVKTSVTLDGKRYAGGILREEGAHTLMAAVTDSRGHVGTVSQILTVLPYKQPSLRVRASRCREDGTADDVGAFARITVTGQIAPVTGENTGQLLLQWGEDRETVALSPGEFQWERIVPVSPEETLEIRAEAQDALLTVIRQMVLSTGYATMDFLSGGKGVAFGKMANRKGFDCAMEAFFTGGVNGLRFGPFGETEVAGPALAAVAKGAYWGLFAVKVGDTTLETARLAGNLETAFALVSGCPTAEGCTGWIVGI